MSMRQMSAARRSCWRTSMSGSHQPAVKLGRPARKKGGREGGGAGVSARDACYHNMTSTRRGSPLGMAPMLLMGAEGGLGAGAGAAPSGAGAGAGGAAGTL